MCKEGERAPACFAFGVCTLAHTHSDCKPKPSRRPLTSRNSKRCRDPSSRLSEGMDLMKGGPRVCAVDRRAAGASALVESIDTTPTPKRAASSILREAAAAGEAPPPQHTHKGPAASASQLHAHRPEQQAPSRSSNQTRPRSNRRNRPRATRSNTTTRTRLKQSGRAEHHAWAARADPPARTQTSAQRQNQNQTKAVEAKGTQNRSIG